MRGMGLWFVFARGGTLRPQAAGAKTNWGNKTQKRPCSSAAAMIQGSFLFSMARLQQMGETPPHLEYHSPPPPPPPTPPGAGLKREGDTFSSQFVDDTRLVRLHSIRHINTLFYYRHNGLFPVPVHTTGSLLNTGQKKHIPARSAAFWRGSPRRCALNVPQRASQLRRTCQ